MFKTILTGFVLGLVLILAVPTTLILASWNAAPGDSTYQVKVGLEKAILGVVPSDNLKTTLEIKYTERRFTEVEKIISNNISPNIATNQNQDNYLNESLTNLTNQAIASKNSLQKIQNTDEKITQTENLITTLETISVKIEETKQNPIPTLVPTKIPTKKNSPTPKKNESIEPTPIPTTTTKIVVSQPTPTSEPTSIPTPTQNFKPVSSTIVSDLENTQQEINQLINELKETSNELNSNKKDKTEHKESKNDSSQKDNQDKDNRSKEYLKHL